jgi:hypothetical protein
MELFYDARAQLKAALCASEGPESPPHEACVVQLGDLGAYSAQPGSQACFDLAKQFLRRVAPHLSLPRPLVPDKPLLLLSTSHPTSAALRRCLTPW